MSVNHGGIINSPVAAILAYCLSSILMTTTNKLVLASFEFKMNFLLLAVQAAVTVVLLEVFVKLGLVSRRPYKSDEARRWFIVSLALVAMIYTGSKALQYLSIPIFTIFKNLTIIMIAYSELLFFNGSPVTPLVFGSFTMMVSSSVIAGWSDLATGQIFKPGANQVSPFVSYGWMLLNCFTSAFFALIMRSKIKQVGFKDFDTVFYNNLLSIPVLLILSLSMERPEFYRTKMRYFGDGVENSSGFTSLCVAIIISGVSGFAISYGSTWCVRVTSSTTYSMVGALNKLPIAIAGMLFFEDGKVTVANVSSVFIAFFGGLVYTYAKNRQKAESAKILPVTKQDVEYSKVQLDENPELKA